MMNSIPGDDNDNTSSTFLYLQSSSAQDDQIFNSEFLELNEFKEDVYYNLPPPRPVRFHSTPANKLRTTENATSTSNVSEILNLYSTPSTSRKTTKMEKLATCSNFSGYSQDNAMTFLSEFESYALLHDLPDYDKRKIAAFHLHLKGPALTWFNTLNSTSRKSWTHIKVLFEEKYINVNNKSSVAMMEGQIFNHMKLGSEEKLEDFHSKLVEKGHLLNKPEHEMVCKFIEGLPEKMAFFVRAGQPNDLSQALTAAKMAETCNYRTTSNQPNNAEACAYPAETYAPEKVSTKDDDKMDKLTEQVSELTKLVSKIQTRDQQQFTRPTRYTQHKSNTYNQSVYQDSDTRTCFKCNATGHISRYCNWNGTGQPTTSKCQLCHQAGHTAFRCKTIKPNQGNRGAPGESRPNRSGP